jgi:hypothetical protein
LLADLALLAELLAADLALAAAPFFSFFTWLLVLATEAVLTKLSGAATNANAANAEIIDFDSDMVNAFNSRVYALSNSAKQTKIYYKNRGANAVNF